MTNRIMEIQKYLLFTYNIVTYIIMSSTLFNISINGSENGFQYGARYTKSKNLKGDATFMFNTNSPIQFYNEDDKSVIDIYQNVNIFERIENIEDFDVMYDTIKSVPKSILTVLFPEWSVETFGWQAPYYILEARTYINGKEIILCKILLNRNDAIAEDEVTTLSNERFYEKLSVAIPDPYWLCHSYEAETFRNNFCVWVDDGPACTKSDYNDEGCILFVKLIPVIKNDNVFYFNEKWSAGSNCINLDVLENKSLQVKLSFSESTPCLDSIIHFDSINYKGLLEYLNDTYPNVNFLKDFVYRYYIMNSDGDMIELTDNGVVTSSDNFSSMTLKSGTTWDSWREGLIAFVIVEFFDENLNHVFTLQSNEVPITPLVFSYLLGMQSNLEIEFKENDMLNIVNKIENRVIQVEKPDEYDAHVISPVFIRSNPTSNIQIHPKVTEYITIRLDAYKSSVKKFTLKLEDSEFVEYARNNYGVVFRVVGSLLTQEAIETLYYILNEKGELVTTGNCKYIV